MQTYKMTIQEALKEQPKLLKKVMEVITENDRKKAIVKKNDKIFADNLFRRIR